MFWAVLQDMLWCNTSKLGQSRFVGEVGRLPLYKSACRVKNGLVVFTRVLIIQILIIEGVTVKTDLL